jgi:membrane-bound serine protease (ClpP class)
LYGAEDDQVLVLEIAGPVTPAMQAYFERGISAGLTQGAEAVVIVLDTPGGSLGVTQGIIQLLRNAELPVIVYIAPAGAQAASAGSLITLAAHAAGMAPETVIGAASPVDGSGADIDETLYRKLVEDLKAQARSMAERRGPEAVVVAEAMIEEARAVHANEALSIGLIDAVATDLPDLLEQLDGLEVQVDGATIALQTAGAQQTTFGRNLIEGVLHALSNPLLVGILLTIGVQAILFELSAPGGFVAGLIGVISLGLAFYGLGQLSANWLGLGLVLLSFVLFILEAKTPGIGFLALGGAVALLAGLLVLFNSPSSPAFARISLAGALLITAVTSSFFIFAVAKVAAAQRKRPITGKEGLIGQSGEVRKTFVSRPDEATAYTGSVFVKGELWRAQASEALERGDEIVVRAADGITLQVSRQATAVERTEAGASR